MVSKIYDQTLEILNQCYQKQQSIKDSQENASKELFELIQTCPEQENDIRMAILHFYNQHGLAAFVHLEESRLQIITRIKNRNNNIYIQRIIEFLKSHKELLESYKQQTATSESFDKLFAFVDTQLNLQEESTKREMIKTALRIVCGIQARDALFFKDGTIKLFKFDYEIVKINNEIRKISQNSHINVLSNEDRKTIEKCLSSVNLESLILQNTLSILEKDIDLSHIDNFTFNKNFSFFAIQKIRIYLENLPLSHIDSIAKGIYCMLLVKKYEWIMFELVAKELLELCAKGNENATHFIEFYNGGSIQIGNRIYKKPIITDNNGNPWTIHLIKECLRNKMNVEFDIEQSQKRSDEIDERLEFIATQIKQDSALKEELTQKVSYHQELQETKSKALRVLTDQKTSSSHSIKDLTEELNQIILTKSQLIDDIDHTSKNLSSLNNEQIRLLDEQNYLKEQINYTLKKNKSKFLQYDLLSRALADAILNAKDIT